MLLKKPLQLSFLLNLAFLVACFGIGGFHFGSLDDFFMSAIVTGAYGGEFDAHTLFVNGAYAYILKPFYALIPKVGWYSIFQFVAVFASFVVFTYYALKRIRGKLGIAVTAFVLACLTPEFYLQIGFTQCAAALTGAGILLLYFGNQEKKNSLLVLSVLFLLLGAIFRKEGFLLGVPFMLMVVCLGCFAKKKIPWRAVLAIVLCFAGYQGLQVFNQSLFQNKEYSYYMAYQWPRATLGDESYFNLSAVYDELEERGKSGFDFRLLRSWNFYDTKVFCLDSLKPIVDVIHRNRYELNKANMPAAILLAIANSFFTTNAWCWVALCLFLFFCAPKKAGLYAWGSLFLVALCLTYLLMQNRVVHRVEMGIWLYATFCAIPFFARPNLSGRFTQKMPALVALMAAGCFVLGLTTQRDVNNDKLFFGTPKAPAELDEFVQYAQKHSGDVFVLGFEQYKTLAIYKDPIYKSAAPHSWGNLIPMGYWNINLPGMKREMTLRGMENPLHDIIHDNVYVLDESNNFQLEKFHELHYHHKVAVDTVRRFGSMSLLKYRLESNEAEVVDE